MKRIALYLAILCLANAPTQAISPVVLPCLPIPVCL